MRSRLLLVPGLVAAAHATPAKAYDFLTVPQARELIFPKAQFIDSKFELTDGDISFIQKAALGAPVWTRKVPVWRVSTGGWFFLDQVLGRDDRITYAVGIDTAGAVKGVEVLVCLGIYDQIRKPDWLKRFVGCKRGGTDPAEVVPVISGTSLSCEHVIEGVRRLMVTHQIMMDRKKPA